MPVASCLQLVKDMKRPAGTLCSHPEKAPWPRGHCNILVSGQLHQRFIGGFREKEEKIAQKSSNQIKTKIGPELNDEILLFYVSKLRKLRSWDTYLLIRQEMRIEIAQKKQF